MKLTIAIPTFNRNEILKRNIQFLLPQITEQCNVLIIDNCSDVPIKETLTELLDTYPSLHIKVERNKVNIGGNANILRCIEYCETEWLWILGDDDIPKPNAVETIFYDLQSNKNITHINYYCEDKLHPQRKNSVYSDGLDDYLQKMDSFAASIFISSNIYYMPHIIENIGYAMYFQYSCAPQFVVLAMSLGNEKRCMYSSKQIVKNDSANTPIENIGSPVVIANGMSILVNLPLPYKSRLLINEKILIDSSKHWIRVESIVYALLAEWRVKGDIKNLRFKYRILNKSYLSRNPNVLFKIKCFLYNVLMKFPTLAYALLNLYLKYSNQNSKLSGGLKKEF